MTIQPESYWDQEQGNIIEKNVEADEHGLEPWLLLAYSVTLSMSLSPLTIKFPCLQSGGNNSASLSHFEY